MRRFFADEELRAAAARQRGGLASSAYAAGARLRRSSRAILLEAACREGASSFVAGSGRPTSAGRRGTRREVGRVPRSARGHQRSRSSPTADAGRRGGVPGALRSPRSLPTGVRHVARASLGRAASRVAADVVYADQHGRRARARTGRPLARTPLVIKLDRRPRVRARSPPAAAYSAQPRRVPARVAGARRSLLRTHAYARASSCSARSSVRARTCAAARSGGACRPEPRERSCRILLRAAGARRSATSCASARRRRADARLRRTADGAEVARRSRSTARRRGRRRLASSIAGDGDSAARSSSGRTELGLDGRARFLGPQPSLGVLELFARRTPLCSRRAGRTSRTPWSRRSRSARR